MNAAILNPAALFLRAAHMPQAHEGRGRSHRRHHDVLTAFPATMRCPSGWHHELSELLRMPLFYREACPTATTPKAEPLCEFNSKKFPEVDCEKQPLRSSV